MYNVIKSAWSSNGVFRLSDIVVDDIKQCIDALVAWNSIVFGHVQKSIDAKKRKLDQLLSASDMMLLQIWRKFLVS